MCDAVCARRFVKIRDDRYFLEIRVSILKKVETLVFESAAWKLILATFLISFFKTGIWYIPNIEFSRLIAQNPFANPFSDPNAHYLFWNWLGPFIAWALGAKSKWAFFMLHFAFSLAFSLLFIKIIFSRLPEKIARSSFVIFSILPVSATAYFWVGTDSITLFLMLLAFAYPEYIVVTLLSGLALGMQHFEQGFFAAAGLLFATLLSRKHGDDVGVSIKFCGALLLGIVAGKLILFGIFRYHSIEINSGRIHWLREHVRLLLSQFFFHFHYIVWSVLGLGWLVALRFIDSSERGKTTPFFVALLGLCLLLPVSGDQTRVLAIITFPLITAYWLLNKSFLEKITEKEISLVFLTWAIMPWGWVWEGDPKWSVLPYDLAYILHRLWGWFDIPENPALWPF